MYTIFHTNTETVTAAVMRCARGAAVSPAAATAALDRKTLAVRCLR